MLSRLNLYRVKAGQGIVSLGALDMSDINIPQSSNRYSWNKQFPVRRSILAFQQDSATLTDSTGTDYVYAISDGAIRSAQIQNLSNPLSTLVLPSVHSYLKQECQ
jgi:hypothetical protein